MIEPRASPAAPANISLSSRTKPAALFLLRSLDSSTAALFLLRSLHSFFSLVSPYTHTCTCICTREEGVVYTV